MQVTFNTDNASDVAFVKQILGVTAAPAPAPTPAHSGPAVPSNAPAGSHWVPSLGAPMLVGPDGSTLAVDWSDPANPKVA